MRAMVRRAASKSTVSGFSQNTASPASKARFDSAMCGAGGVAMYSVCRPGAVISASALLAGCRPG